MTAAALDARDDLGAAAISMQRLGELTSGMWRALSRELVTAADRLDRQAEERLDELEGRAHALGVAPDAVLAAAAAAGHLDEHRQTLERLELGGWVLPIDLADHAQIRGIDVHVLGALECRQLAALDVGAQDVLGDARGPRGPL